MRPILLTVVMLLTTTGVLISQQSGPTPPELAVAARDSLAALNGSYRKKPHIAVLPFVNANTQAMETEFGRTTSSMLATALRNQTNFVVLERGELQQVLAEQMRASAGLTKEKARELGELYNVEVILTGDVSLIDNTLHIDARLIETETAEIAVALFGACHDLTRIRDVIGDLAQELEQRYLRQWMGSIAIISQPAGAEVYLDGKFIGLTDLQQPLQISNLLEGAYQLKLIRGGYFDWQGEIAVLAKMERTVKVSLIAKPGSMNIYSEPAGAQVFLDNSLVGETPMSLREVAEGEHEIRLVKENFKPWQQKVVVRSFQPTDVKATLEVSPGILTVNSEPAGAEIYLKGKLVATTPHTLNNIPPGEIVVRVEKTGYEEWTTSVLIEPNSQKVLDVTLTEKTGMLSILSQPTGATVHLSKAGEATREIGTTPVLNYTATIGRYTVEVEKEDYFTECKNLIVAHKQISDVRFDLQEKPGAILVETDPANARVLLNSSLQGRAPLLMQDLKKGTYEVTVSLPYAEQLQQVQVEPNRQAVVQARIKKPQRYLFGMASIGIAGILVHLLAN